MTTGAPRPTRASRTRATGCSSRPRAGANMPSARSATPGPRSVSARPAPPAGVGRQCANLSLRATFGSPGLLRALSCRCQRQEARLGWAARERRGERSAGAPRRESAPWTSPLPSAPNGPADVTRARSSVSAWRPEHEDGRASRGRRTGAPREPPHGREGLAPVERCTLRTMIRAEDLVGEEWAEWYRLTPAQRWAESLRLWDAWLLLGGSLDPEPDTQSPFFDAGAPSARPAHGRPGLRVVRRSGV